MCCVYCDIVPARLPACLPILSLQNECDLNFLLCSRNFASIPFILASSSPHQYILLLILVFLVYSSNTNRCENNIEERKK